MALAKPTRYLEEEEEEEEAGELEEEVVGLRLSLSLSCCHLSKQPLRLVAVGEEGCLLSTAAMASSSSS